MIRRHDGPIDPALAQPIADLQARAYEPTGMRSWNAQEVTSLFSNPCNRLYTFHGNTTKATNINAFLFATFVAGETEILSLAVDPSCLRAGIASRIVQFVCAECQRENIDAIILEVAVNNYPALSFYNSLTFVKIGLRQSYYAIDGCLVDAAVLKKRIIP